jgi:hypothetical protein
MPAKLENARTDGEAKKDERRCLERVLAARAVCRPQPNRQFAGVALDRILPVDGREDRGAGETNRRARHRRGPTGAGVGDRGDRLRWGAIDCEIEHQAAVGRRGEQTVRVQSLAGDRDAVALELEQHLICAVRPNRKLEKVVLVAGADEASDLLAVMDADETMSVVGAVDQQVKVSLDAAVIDHIGRLAGSIENGGGPEATIGTVVDGEDLAGLGHYDVECIAQAGRKNAQRRVGRQDCLVKTVVAPAWTVNLLRHRAEYT